ncbi:MauE/DoxX family redox-associated membrane protein [Candidatus Nitrotoga sp. AM1P]|uniref:MauE/DoxX family redox-associated membrane protein n=1 Tax=Candidatus Nitrotoga sp. AM1P TaxID=2559597 RepID=UPI0010BC3D84|nr:MauE/DoxX family redox-associated membrane protein [Candidatus Nitrotoga sp. AM1P]BBJ22127.1 hypothetical protein W01_00540 [Candidatus Nitrotoga sp. AM1P]
MIDSPLVVVSINELLVTARLILIAVFITAGIAKLSNPQGFKEGLIDFGVPYSLRKPIGMALPFVELSLAMLLIPSSTVWWTSVASLLLLVAFTLAITFNLAQGRHPACNCFGANAKPINAVTLLRNVGLIACSLFLALYGAQFEHLSIAAWLSGVFASLGVSTMLVGLFVALIGIGGWIILTLTHQQGRLMLRIDNLELRLEAAGIGPVPKPISTAQGLDVGTLAPYFSLPRLRGGTVSLDDLLVIRKPVLLVFSDPGCGPCTAMLPRLALLEQESGFEITLVLVSRGSVQENLAKLGELSLDKVLLQTDREVANLYMAVATPSAVRINVDGLIDSHLALGELDIASLVHELMPHHLSVPSRELFTPSLSGNQSIA